MANPLFDGFGMNNQFQQIINEVQQFQKTFNGDPKQEVEKMLNNGTISQADFNRYSQIANQIMAFMPK